jgi:GDP-L-fucose synthase
MTILVLGATGFVGGRVCRLLAERKRTFVRSSRSLGADLRERDRALELFQSVRPDHVVNCASFVGGVQYGLKYPVEIFDNNLRIITNLFHAAEKARVKRIVNPIANCVYPRAKSLFKEAEIWDGALDESILVYGMARKMSWVASWAYARECGLDTLNLVLSNMYGPGDHFEEERSHALGALVMKFVTAKAENAPNVVVWGTGDPVREWLYVDDGAEAMVRALDAPATTDFVNVGVAEGVSVRNLAESIRAVVGYGGDIVYDRSKPDGAPYKTVDGARGEQLLGWRPAIGLDEGIARTVAWYEANRGAT